MSIGTMLFNPFTGKPRDPSDIASDPRGILVWDGEEPLKAAAPQPPEQPAPQGGLTDDDLERVVVSALSALGRNDLWSALTYCSGPYEITKVTHVAMRLFRAIERELLATRKRSEDEVVRIMQAANGYRWSGCEQTRAALERLVRGDPA